jgi:signal transduction histidine kinase
MYVGDREDGGPFTEREYTLLLVLAGEVGIAIENSNLYADLQSKIVQLEHVVQELNNTQNQLIQSEKLASIGQLASGIAHEIRNPLGTILSGLEFLSSTIAGKDSTADEAIGRMKQSISRANNIIVELLKFSRASKMELKTVDMRGLLDEVVDLLENQIKTANICVKKNYPGDPAWVCIDITLMRQVIFNLITNAIDAMPNGGELTMSLRRETGEQGQSEVVVEIGDTGCGIPEDKINRIFDPFFTTKEPGKGTGLGLSISHLILERHKAAISVKSLIEKGTTFTLRFSGADTP